MQSVLINRNYTLFTIGTFVGATGSWIQSVALSWLVLELSDSAFILGLVGFARMVPLLFLAFPAGGFADRVDRRKMMLTTQSGAAVIAAALAVTVWLGLATIPLLIVLALLAGIFDAFTWPVWSVFIKDLVGPEKLRTAVAVNSTRFNMTRIIGPSIGGFLLATSGSATAFAIAALFSLGTIGSLLSIRLPPYLKRESGPWLPALLEGLRYAIAEKEVVRLLAMTTGLGLFVLPYQQLLAKVARDVLDTGPEGLGILLTAVGVGAIVGAVFSGARLVQRHARPLVVVLAIGCGVSLAALGLSRSVPVASVMLGLLGLCSIGYMTIAQASLQLSVREDIVGRVMGLWTVVQAGMMPLGSLGLGALGDEIGMPMTLVLGGAAAVIVALVIGGRDLLALLPAAKGDQRRADAEQQQRGHHIGRSLEAHRPANQADRRL